MQSRSDVKRVVEGARWSLVVLLAVGFLASGCSLADSQTENVEPVGPTKEPPQDAREFLERVEEARPGKERLRAELAEMSVPDLVELLEEESKQEREPFNSLAFREIRRRGRNVGDELSREVAKDDRQSFLAILALREVSRPAYEELDRRVTIDVLIERLETNRFFNAWGLPHLYWEDAANALIEQGREAEDSLRALLEDDRPAPVYGSEEAMESERYGYRVKDYAFVLLSEITDERAEVPVSPQERDELIEQSQR